MPFGNLQVGCRVPLTKEWLLSGHLTLQVCLVDYCRDDRPSGGFSSLHRGTLSDRMAMGVLVTFLLPDGLV